jgi:hypothetical protein
MVRLNALIAAFVLLIAGVSLRAAPTPALATASIQGEAWTAHNTALPHAKLRLRNVDSGNVDGAAQANEAGRFAFGNVKPGSYVVELVDSSGAVLAVSQRIVIASGQNVATIVRLPARGSFFSGFFGNAAAAAASGAASLGITALAPVGRPASAGR